MMLARVAFATALLATLVGCRPAPLASTCADWAHLDPDGRLQSAQALIQPWQMATVRERQHLDPSTPDGEVFVAVASSLTKNCELAHRPGLRLAELVSQLYGSN